MTKATRGTDETFLQLMHLSGQALLKLLGLGAIKSTWISPPPLSRRPIRIPLLVSSEYTQSEHGIHIL